MSVSFYNLTVKGILDLVVLGSGVGKKIAVLGIHINIGNISDGYDSLQFIITVADRKGNNSLVLHHIPGIFQGHGAVCIRLRTNVHILYLRSNVSQIGWRLHAKTVQHILGLLIDLACASWNVALGLSGSVLDISISNRGADGICIRIFVSHYKYFLILHSHSSFQNSADLCTLFICK